MLYITVWEGEEKNWITLTTYSKDQRASDYFDEGVCAGFTVAKSRTTKFCTKLMELLKSEGNKVAMHL